jgi:hypothetical protein
MSSWSGEPAGQLVALGNEARRSLEEAEDALRLAKRDLDDAEQYVDEARPGDAENATLAPSSGARSVASPPRPPCSSRRTARGEVVGELGERTMRPTPDA